MAGPLINTITYGATPYTFPFTSLDVESTVVYAEDGFTNIGVKYVFTVSGWIGGNTQNDLNTQIDMMETNLRTPRQPLSIQWSGDGNATLYSFDGTGSDLDWGPKPGDLQLIRFYGGRSAMYRWNVTVTSKELQCGSQTIPTPVLAITWKFANDIDINGLTTRTTTGTLVVTSSSVMSGSPADSFRFVITSALGLPLWFQRINERFEQSADGRVLFFTIVDKEKQWTFPTPVTNGNVTWLMRIPQLNSGNQYLADYVLSGWFETSTSHSKFELWQCVINLIVLKYSLVQGTLIPGERTIKEDVYNNRIDFTITAQGTVDIKAGGIINYNTGINSFFIAPPGSNGQPLTPGAYGGTDNLSSGVPIQAPVDFDACSGQGTSYQLKSAQGGQQGQTNVPINGSRGQPLASQPSANSTAGASNTQINTPFIAFHETISYEVDNHIAVFAPKTANANTILQQTAMPTTTIIQAGYFKQVAPNATKVSGPNKPIKQAPDALMKTSYVSPAIPEPIGDGSVNCYTLNWRYVMAVQSVLQDASLVSLEPIWPSDPRRNSPEGSGGSNSGALEQLPAIAVIPSGS